MRLLVVSHPSVIAVNQAVYLSMVQLKWELLIVVRIAGATNT
jgi:hypothetical protein